MNKIVKKKWVSALRSGEYKKTCQVMRKGQGKTMCVMGVLADLYRIEKNIPPEEYHTLTSENEFPKREVLNWAGLTVSEAHSLVDSNDDDGTSFKEFADLIEKEQFNYRDND